MANKFAERGKRASQMSSVVRKVVVGLGTLLLFILVLPCLPWLFSMLNRPVGEFLPQKPREVRHVASLDPEATPTPTSRGPAKPMRAAAAGEEEHRAEPNDQQRAVIPVADTAAATPTPVFESRAAIEQRVRDLMARGEKLLKDAKNLPELVFTHWTLHDILQLVARGQGVLLASVKEEATRRWYVARIDPAARELSSVARLTEGVRRTISNRLLQLHAPTTADDPDWLPKLEVQVRRHLAVPERAELRLFFAPVTSLDERFAAKQLAAVDAAAGLAEAPASPPKSVQTRGRLCVTEDRVAYIVESVSAGDSPAPWDDPEKKLLDAAACTRRNSGP